MGARGSVSVRLPEFVKGKNPPIINVIISSLKFPQPPNGIYRRYCKSKNLGSGERTEAGKYYAKRQPQQMT